MKEERIGKINGKSLEINIKYVDKISM